MANFFETLFGRPKKRDLNLGTPVTATIPGFADLRKRVEGMQMGYGPEFVERATSPFVTQREVNWARKEKPALEESYGERGLGRSTIAARDIGEASAQKERDIQQMISEATLQNLQQGKTDLSSQLSNLYNIGQAEATQANLASADEAARRKYQVGQEQQADLGETQFLNKAIGSGLAIAASVATGNPALALGALSSMGNSSGIPQQSQLDVIKDILSGGGVTSSIFTRAPQITKSGPINLPTSRQLARPGALTVRR